MLLKELHNVPLFEGKETFYHGSNTKIEKFTDKFLDRPGATNQEGPGIYLTTAAQDARAYGKVIHTVEAKIVKSKLLPAGVKTPEFAIRTLIQKAPDSDLILTDWDEDPKKALIKAVSGILEFNRNDYREALEQVWADFYRGESAAFLTILRNWNYQGFKLNRADGVTHFICWDPSILTIKNIEEIK